VPRVGEERVTVNVDLLLRQMVRHNLAVLGSVNSNARHFTRALEDIRAIRNVFGTILEDGITHRYALAEYEKGFASLGDPQSLKVVFDIRSS